MFSGLLDRSCHSPFARLLRRSGLPDRDVGEDGDLGLVGCLSYGVFVLQRGNVYIPPTLQNEATQIELLMLSLFLGTVISATTTGLRSGHFGNIYHDVIVAPMILFLAIILIPVVWYNTSWHDISIIAGCIATWIVLIYTDIKVFERFNQRQHLLRNGFQLKGEKLRD